MAAAQLGPAEREAFLEQECGEDHSLRNSVCSLLHYDGVNGRVLDQDLPGLLEGIAAWMETDNDQGEPFQVGPYRVTERLGSGGMGTVFLAQQESPKRKVALKILHPGLVDDLGKKRFHREIQVLAMLRHPGIAQVYETGTMESPFGSVPYFAMEWVRGRDLKSSVFAKELSRAEVLRLFLQVCDAVQYAHAQGVVHRDLKPPNILMDEHGNPKVLDFGVALVQHPDFAEVSLVTEPGALIGTLSSMSPEQCSQGAVAVDHRTDVYSLGALLCELLSGSPPYDLRGLSLTAAIQVIHRTPPEIPPAGSPKLPRPLLAILAKSLEKDADRRYRTVNCMASDVQRYLDGQPISATPPSWWRRMVLLATRHPAWATAAICSVIVVGALGLTALLVTYMNRDPVGIRLDLNSNLAQLKARSGNVLHSWYGGRDGGIPMAGVFERPAEYGGGKVAGLVYDLACTDRSVAGQLCFYDVDDPSVLEWSSSELGMEHPPSVVAYGPETSLSATKFLAADFFPESPGIELAYSQGLSPHSAQAIRIVNLRGDLLYEVWHDGAIDSFRWLEGPRKLLVSAVNSAGVDGGWAMRGHPELAGDWPAVVFCLEPKLGYRNSEQWVVEPGRAGEATLMWYRWLGPAEALVALPSCRLSLTEPGSGQDGQSFSMAEIRFDCRKSDDVVRFKFGILIDEHGEIVQSVESDRYRACAQLNPMPPVEAFRFFDYEDLPGELD